MNDKKQIIAAMIGYLSLGVFGNQQPASSISKEERKLKKKLKKIAQRSKKQNRKRL